MKQIVPASGKPTFAAITIDALAGVLKATAGLVGEVTIGSSLSFSDPTLNTIQDIRVTATPQFVGLTLSGLASLGGGFGTNQRTETTTYSIAATDSVIICDGSFTATLPTPVGIPGRIYTIKRIGASGDVTLATAAGLIDGVATQVMTAQYESITVISDGANWYII